MKKRAIVFWAVDIRKDQKSRQESRQNVGIPVHRSVRSVSPDNNPDKVSGFGRPVACLSGHLPGQNVRASARAQLLDGIWDICDLPYRAISAR